MTIKEIQSALLSLGYAPGKVDGILGPRTVKAVMAFQGNKRLKKDGIPGPITSKALKSAVEAFKLGTTPPTAHPPKPPVAPPVAVEQTVNRYNPKDAVDYYKSLGWTHMQSVALVANLMFESGGNRHDTIYFDAHGDRDKDGISRSHGAGQWNERAGRYDGLLEYARGMGLPWDNPRVQLGFLQRELVTTEKRAAAKLREAATLEEAVNAAIGIWRPSIPHADKRLAVARRLFDSF
jgi:hypothetical protein